MNVWLTRSEPGASRQARALRDAGHRCLVEPVLEIEPQPEAPPPGPFDLIIFLSEQAVRHGLSRLVLGSARLLAVGARTAAVLAAAGHDARIPAHADSEGLLALDELLAPAGLRILLVSGVGGRSLLGPELERRGAHVARFECYRRRPRPVADIDTEALDAIVASSAEGVGSLASGWFAAGGSADIALLVPSARVAAHAVALGFRNVHDCGGADTAAVLQGLQRIAGTA